MPSSIGHPTPGDMYYGPHSDSVCFLPKRPKKRLIAAQEANVGATAIGQDYFSLSVSDRASVC